MELNKIPEAFQTKLRIAILSSVIQGKKTFKEIKELTGATDGNISVQTAKLEELGYLVIHKKFVGKKTCTTYEISEFGREEFKAYVEMLQNIISVGE